MKILTRHIASKICESAKLYPIVTVTGPRQSGKTTLIREIFADYTYVSLEDPDKLEFFEQDPHAFLETYSDKVIFDEVQNAPKLFSYLQKIVDQDDRVGKFILSGSQQFLLNKKISQTFAGRTALFRLLPFSLAELTKRKSQLAWSKDELVKISKPSFKLYEVLYSGMYPRLHCKKIPANKFYMDYVDTYVTRDVRTLINVGNLRQFQTFLRLLAARCGQRINYTSLGNDLGVDQTTIKRWISVLEASYIIYLLAPHYNNFNKRLVKSPKIYFLDTGLLCYLLKIKSAQELVNHSLLGGIFETFVFSELYKSFAHNDEEVPLYFWQDLTGNEIDFLIEKSEASLPLEVKAAKTISADFFKNLHYWLKLKDNPQKNGYLIYGGDDWQSRGDESNNLIKIIPWFAVS